jgi:hypothetical protein
MLSARSGAFGWVFQTDGPDTLGKQKIAEFKIGSLWLDA